MTFKNLTGGMVRVTYVSKPLGISFCGTSPISVCHLQRGGLSAAAGVMNHWTLMSINDRDVRSLPFEEVRSILFKCTEKLPFKT